MIKQSNTLFYFLIVTFLITIFISSCSKKEHKRLKDDKFTEVLAELMIIENLGIQEFERIILAKNVFEKHKIDSAAFNETRRFYAENEKYWIKIYTKVKDKIQIKLDSLQTISNNPEDIIQTPEE